MYLIVVKLSVISSHHRTSLLCLWEASLIPFYINYGAVSYARLKNWCLSLSNLLLPVFCLFCLRAKWLSWLQIAVSSPTATAGTSWPAARQQGTARCWRWGVSCVIPQGCIWILSSEAGGVSSLEVGGAFVQPPFRLCEMFFYLKSLFFCLFE